MEGRGAFIDRYVGDAVMAFFNAPIRYGDHGARDVALAGPLAVVLGFRSAFAAGSTNLLAVLDTNPIRIPLMVLAARGVAANLYTVWHGHRLRQRATAEDRFVALTRQESR